MPIIASRNFATGTQQYLSLSSSDYLRTLTIGQSWLRLRIGILYALGTVAENAWSIRSPSLCLGVSSGPSSSPSVQSPSHCAGFSVPTAPVNAAPTTVLTYNAGSAGNSYFSTAGYAFFKYTAGSLATGAVGSFTTVAPTTTTLGGALARRGMLIVDINKSAALIGNLTFGAYSTAAGHMGLDITSSDLYWALDWASATPTIQGVAMNGLALGNTLAFNETVNGLLDTIFLFWGSYVSPLQLYEIAVYKVG